MLLATAPLLAGIQPNDGDLLPLKNIDGYPSDAIGVRSIAPSSLTIRFDEKQVLDPATLAGVRVLRSGLDGEFDNDFVVVRPGYIGVGDVPNQNEIVVRFAETLPDDLYRVELSGIDDTAKGMVALRNTQGDAFAGDTENRSLEADGTYKVDFELALGPQVVATVPQPVTRSATGLSQARNQIVVYFNDDELFVEDDASGKPTPRSAENPAFYQLIFTQETVDNTDDVVFYPSEVQYNADANTATMIFLKPDGSPQNLDELVVPAGYPDAGQLLGPGTFRLRIGTNEQTPPPPTQVSPQAQVAEDFNTGGAGGGGVDVTFTARADLAKSVNLSITKGHLEAGAPPTVNVVGTMIQIVLNENGPSTADDLRAAVAGNADAAALVAVTLAGNPNTDITIPADATTSLRVVGLGSSYETATDLGTAVGTSRYLLISSAIDPQETLLDYPGSPDEPGHRDLPGEITGEQHVNPLFGADRVAGVTTILYNFRRDYGFDANGDPLSNAITENQKQRVRESVELWGRYLGVQFLETADQGLTFVTGDVAALNPADSAVVDESGAGFRVRVDPTCQNGMLIVAPNALWSDDYGREWFQRAMVGLGFMLGLERANDLPVTNLMAFDATDPFQGGLDNFFSPLPNNTPPEPIFPGNADILHGQYVYRPDSNDIDLYRFTVDLQDQSLDEPKTGVLTLETFAERLPNSSLLDTVLSLYREVPVRDRDGAVIGYERELISRNDDYYSSDSYISVSLGSGTYYIGVTASGNTSFDPTIEGTGSGGRSQGLYDLRVSYRAQVDTDDTISDLDRIRENRPGTRLDGDADRVPGGVYNFWFQTRPLDRRIEITGTGAQFVDGQTLTLEDGARTVKVFEFDQDGTLNNAGATRVTFSAGSTPAQIAAQIASQIDALHSTGFGITADYNAGATSLTLHGDRSTHVSAGTVGVELAGKTIFVDKTSGANLTGSLQKPFDSVKTAFAAAVPGDIVRFVGNGGVDRDPATILDNYAYEVGLSEPGAPLPTLKDGATMDVPQGVTVMIDAGAIFKLRRAYVGVGSSTLTVDRSGGSLQVLGTPHLLDVRGNVLRDSAGQPVPGSVYFTSLLDESIGQDGTAAPTLPAAGDWGGIAMRADLDNAESRRNLESEGIFLNYVNRADIRYGGGLLKIDSVDQVVNPIQIAEMRPTVTFNTITESADAAMSADPDSFEETNFQSPRYQLNRLFTSDYERVGPEIVGNHLEHNSINGLFVRIETPVANQIKTLTVPGRFDDIDIVHVLAENLEISGQAGQAILETQRPSVIAVTLSGQSGGSLAVGDYAYKLVFVDENGFEGRPSEATAAGTVAAGQGSLLVENLPPVTGSFVTRRLYRSQVGGSGPYQFVADLDASDTFFLDDGLVTGYTLQRDPPSALGVTLTPQTAGGALVPGTYNYRIVFADDAGRTSPASDPTVDATVDMTQDSVQLSNLPVATGAFTKRLLYRSAAGGAGPYTLIAELPNAAGNTFVDGGVAGTETLDPLLLGVVRARPDARLKIDPGTVVKLEGARIEVSFGAQLIAEGFQGQEIIFTSKLDDRFGAGGTFDTNDDGVVGVDAGAVAPTRGQWAGLYIGRLGKLNLDHAYVGYGGGNDSKIEGTFKGFNVIELQQADARIANSVIEQNDNGIGGQGPNDRFGRGPNERATIFVRGCRPVILNNIIRDNADVAIDINADTLTNEYVSDPGRTTGPIDQSPLYRDNQGPLVRGNRIANNGPSTPVSLQGFAAGEQGTNGMKIRTAGLGPGDTDPVWALARTGITLSTESVWDDTDIVHILYDEIRVPNFQTYGGLRLESSPDESLVIKLFSPVNPVGPPFPTLSWEVGNAINDLYNDNPTVGAGFTATGTRLEIEDRIGGAIYVLGQPGFPVIMTSIHDDTVGAGLQPDGQPQTDTNNDGNNSEPEEGDWRSVRLDQFSHDRNVEIVLEQESPTETAPGINASVEVAQLIGELASSETEGDENLRMGFVVYGFLNAPNDVDVYSFTAEAGTEIWLDIDRSTSALDTVVEVLNSDGDLIALSDNSLDETLDPSLLYSNPQEIAATSVRPLQKLAAQYQPRNVSGLDKDYWSTNEFDAGLRILLPGVAGTRSTYTFRVRSSNLKALDDPARLEDPAVVDSGLTSGVYQIQLRIRETDEVPGSTVRYAEMRYAQNGVEVIGLPAHSPLLGEAYEDEATEAELQGNGFYQPTASNDAMTVDAAVPGNRPQDLGNLFETDRAVLSVGGTLSDSADVDFYQFNVDYTSISSNDARHTALTFDMDYADGIGRPNTTVTVFQQVGDVIRPVLIGRDSNVADDRSAPAATRDPSDSSGVWDLSRGSVGSYDPFIGTVEMPEGNYFVAVTSAGQVPLALDPTQYPQVRLEPIDSLVRIADDHIGSYGGATAQDPLVPVLLDPTFAGTGSNLWHVSNLQAATTGHGVTSAFDGSRVDPIGGVVGVVAENEPNDSLGTAQSVENEVWSVNANGNIFWDTAVPHLTISATGNDTVDYYSFVVPTTWSWTQFDVDFSTTDTAMVLFDSAGNVVASNDDWGPDPGSTTTPEDPFFLATLRAGTYYIGVGGAAYSPTNLNVPVPPNTFYTLHISVANHLVGNTTGTGGATFYFGNEATGTYGNGGPGDLISNAFSLQDYSAADKPTLYFNYRLGAGAGDNFRVYVQRPDGSSQLVASSLASEVTSTVTRLYNDGANPRWRQARVELDLFAGLDPLRIKYSFTGANGASFFSGVHVDDVIIGFAERGEMITNAPAVDTSFPIFRSVTGAPGVLSGAYQLEIRRSEQYGTSTDVFGRVGGFLQNQLTLDRSFDTNDRLVQETTLVAPPGNELQDGDWFQLGDGANVVAFEFDKFGDPNYGRVSAGRVRIPFRGTDPDYVIAAAIRDAINSGAVQVLVRLQATLSDGTDSGSAGRSNKIVLFGNASGDILISSGEVPVVDGTTPDQGTADDGSALRTALLGVGVEPVGQANLIGGASSAGLFHGGSAIFGIDAGIVLSTGDIGALAGPNLNDFSSGVASNSGDADLDAVLGTTTTDATSLEFQFSLATAGTLYLDYVFASEEYNERATPADAFAILIKRAGTSTWVNYALVPGTALPVSTGNVNGTTNAAYYHNNDPSDAGEFLRELGYDGFSDVLHVAIPLDAGIHAVKFAVADVGDKAGDTAVLIRQASFATVASVEPRGLAGIFHDGYGDENAFRDQGQTLIHSNTILNAHDYAILADAGDRDVTPNATAYSGGPVRLQQPHLGPVRNLLNANNTQTSGVQGGFAPGVVIANNTISGEGLGGIHFSGDLPTMELTIERNARYPQFVCDYTAGDAIADGDWFSVTVGRTTVEFEFDDIARAADKTRETRRPIPSGGSDPGIKPGRVPVYYRRSTCPGVGYSEYQMALAIKSAIDNSILVTNGTTQVARTYVAASRSSGDATGAASFNVSSPDGDWAVYIEGAREVQAWGVDLASLVFENIRVVAHERAAQPFGRIVNNTIHGYDGSESLFPESPTVEQNDTIFNAVDTEQGRAASRETYTATAQIGDNTSLSDRSQDVDFYQFQLDIGDHAQIAVTGTQFTPELRLFNSIGQELERNGPGAPFGALTYTVTGTTVNIDFYAEVGDTYFVAVSGPGNTAYSPLSLGSRSPATATGTYSISVDVLAPRTWVIDTRTLVNNATTLTIYDVTGNSRTITTPGSGDTPTLSNSLRAMLHRILPTIRATEYGGLNPESGSSGYYRWWYPRTDYERFVVVEGASKITGGDALLAGLWPILNTNNDDGLLPETGILISEHATPTLLNNVLSNNRNAIIQTLNQPDELLLNRWSWGAPILSRTSSSVDQYSYNTNALYNDYNLSPAVAVVASELFQHNWGRDLQTGAMQVGNWGLSEVALERAISGVAVRLLTEDVVVLPDNQDFNIPLANTAPLFVNSADWNFFPAPTARSIDSSVSTLGERPKFAFVKKPMGISDSPILAPIRDASGQLRIDDPNVAPPQGQGQNVFIDRGSLDRSDFVGPLAILIGPQDNDIEGQDLDPANTVVHLAEGVYSSFSIQLLDGFETADPFPGVGVNDDTVVGPDSTGGRLPGAAVTVFRNGVFLQEGIDYAFRYDRVSNTIHLIPTSGIWPDNAVYVIRLGNRDRYVLNAPTGDPALDRQKFFITDSLGTMAMFQYDSGFTLQVPQSLTLRVPAVGTGAGGITDGQRFTIRDASNPSNRPVTFEFDVNTTTQPGNIPVHFSANATAEQLAQALVAALNGAGLGLSAKVLSGGQVHVGAPANVVLDTGLSQLTQTPTTLTLAVPAVTGSTTTPDVGDGQTFAINDGLRTVTFELDNNGAVTAGNTRVDIRTALTVTAVADQIATTVRASGLSLSNVQHVGNGLVYLHSGAGATLTLGATARLLKGNVSRPLADGETFSIAFDHDGSPSTPAITRTFEFDSDGVTTSGNMVVPFDLGNTSDEIAAQIGTSVASVGPLKLATAKGIGGGIAYLGGNKAYTVTLSANSSLAIRDQPDYASPSSLLLPSPLTINVPANGGAGITRGQYFTITDTSVSPATVVAFEFTDGSRPPTPGRLPVLYSVTDSAATVAATISQAISDAIQAVPDFLVTVTPTPVTNGTTVGVQLTDANSYHSLDITGSTGTLTTTGGRIADGDLFQISYLGAVTTFEFDNNSSYNTANVPILFAPTDNTDKIADAVVKAIKSVTALHLNGVQYLVPGSGVIELNDTSAHAVTVNLASPDLLPSVDTLTKQGVPGGAVPVPFEPWAGFTGEAMAQAVWRAINGSTGLSRVTAALRGDNTVFVDFGNPDNSPVDFALGPACITGISNYFLRAIQDVPGNPLKPNQLDGETQFTIILPGAAIDFGDAPDDAVTTRYPTLFANNGARHVISDTGLYLGSRVDGNADGLPVPPALGDDLDHFVDLGTSSLRLTGMVPYTLQVPATGVVDKGRFSIQPQGLTPVIFEFFDTTIPNNTLSPDAQVAVNFRGGPSGDSAEQIAQTIVSAVENANLGLAPAYLGGARVYLGGAFLQRIQVGNTKLHTSGVPVNLLYAVSGAELADGQQFTIDDGVHLPLTFEFDSDGSVTIGTRRVPFTAADSAATVAAALQTAVAAANTEGLLSLSLTDLGSGTLHVEGLPSHALNLYTGTAQDSLLWYAGYTPATIAATAAGLSLHLSTLALQIAAAAGGGLSDGQTFTVDDGTNAPVTFEFDADGNFSTGHRAIAWSATAAPETVAAAIQAAVRQAAFDGALQGVAASIAALTPRRVDLSVPADCRVDVSASGVQLAGSLAILVADAVGGGLTDGETFVIDDGTNPSVTFEFDRNGSYNAQNRAIAYRQFDSGETIAAAIKTAIDQAVSAGLLTGLVASISAAAPREIDLAASAYHRLDVSGSGLGRMGVVAAGDAFDVTDSSGHTVRFEFVKPGNPTTFRPVVFHDSDSANDIANAVVAAIRQAVTDGVLDALTPLNYGGGEIQIGGGASLAVLQGVYLSGHGQAGGVLDGQTFTLLDGTTTRRFEFDADGKTTPGNLKIAFTSADTSSDMAALILHEVSQSGYALDLLNLGAGKMAFEGDDEDGVSFDDMLTPGAAVPITVTASAHGLLDAWIDYNGDGDFLDQFEHVFASQPLEAGVNRLTINVPSTVSGGTRYARFRFSSQGGLAPTGLAVDGEVEDYAVPIYTNAAPVLAVPGQAGQPAVPPIFEDTDTVIPGISVSDADAVNDVIHVTLTVLHGTLTVNTAVVGGLAPSDVTGNGSVKVTLAGTPGQISTTLRSASGLVYRSNANDNHPDLLSVEADDLGNTGTGGPRRDYETVPLTVQPVNDPPALNLPATVTFVEDTPGFIVMPTNAVQDVDAAESPGDGLLTVTLDALYGVITVRTDVTNGLTAANFTAGNSGKTVQFTATVAAINVTLSAAAGVTYAPDLNFNGTTDRIVVTANDRGNTDAATGTPAAQPLQTLGTIPVTVTAVNDAPVVAVPAATLTTNEDSPMSLQGFDVTDVDSGSTDITVTLTVDNRSDGFSPNGTLTIGAVTGGVLLSQVGGNGTSAVTITAPVALIHTTLTNANGWSYAPPPNFFGSERLTVTANDGGATGSGAALSDTRTVTLVVQQVNDAPVVTAPATVTLNEDQTLAIGPLSVTDVDDFGGTESVKLTVTHGTMTVTAGMPGGVPASGITNNGTGQVTLRGSVPQLNVTLGSNPVYQANPNYNGPDQLVIVADDGGNPSAGLPAAIGTATVAITVNAINDAPVVTIPGNLQVNEDTDLRIPAVSLTDVETLAGTGDGAVTLTLAVTPERFSTQAGTITVNAGAVNPGLLTVTNNGSALVTVQGRLADVNTMLANPTGVVYRDAQDANGEVLLTITVNDHGNYPGPALQDTKSLTITVVPVNDAPVFSVPGAQAAVEDQNLVIHGVSVSDVDIVETTSTGTGTGLATVTLSAAHGTLDVDAAAGVGVTVTNDGSSAVTLNGPLSGIRNILAAPAGITYRGLSQYNGGDTITLTANDLGNWPAPSRITTATIGINVAADNDAPEVTVPGAQTLNEDRTLYFPAISVTDVDVADGTLPTRGTLIVDLAVGHGTLTVDTTITNGVTRTEVQNNGTGAVRIISTPAKINTTLAAAAGLRYAPNANYNGADQLTITADDQGNFPPPVQRTTKVVPLTVVAVNDAPVLTLPAPPLTSEDTPKQIVFPATAVHDVDAAELPGDGLLDVTLSVASGVLTVRTDTGGITLLTAPAGAIVQFEGTEAAVNALLSNATGVLYSPNLNFNGHDTMVVTVNDRGNTDSRTNTPGAVALETTGTVSITVVAVNDAPILQAPTGPLDVNEDTDLVLSGPAFWVYDVDAAEGTGQIRMDFNVFQGAIAVNTNVSGGLGAGNVQGNGSNQVVLIGTPDQINATLAGNGVVYRGPLNYYGSTELDASVTDQIGTVVNYGSGGAGYVSRRIPITIHPVNDAPVVTIAVTGAVIEDTPVSLAFTVNDVEIADPNVTWTVTLQSAVGFFTVQGDISGGVPTTAIGANGSGTVTLTGTGLQIQKTLETAGAVVFQGNPNSAGPGSASVTVIDPGAPGTGSATSSATVTFTATAVNDAPVITLPQNQTVAEDNQLPLGGATKIKVEDVDSGSGSITVTLQVSNGTLTVNPTVPFGLGPGNISGNGSGFVVLTSTEFAINRTLSDPAGVIYQGNANFSGLEQLQVTADDRGNSGSGGALTDVEWAAITVTPVNDPPRVAHPVADIVVDEGAPSTVIELFPGVFEDPDNTVLTLTVSGNTMPTLASATIAGTKLTLTYLPYQSNRSTTISVTASDGGAVTATDSFVVTVRPVPNAPYVENPIPDVTVLAGTLTRDVNLANVFSDHDFDPNDPAGDVLTLSYNDLVNNTNRTLVTGQLVGGNTLRLTFNNPTLFGRADLTVTATDKTGLTASDTFTVWVNVPPTARNDTAVTKEDTAVGIPVYSNDSDADGTIDRTTVAIVAGSGPSHGAVAVNATTGVVTYTPGANYTGTDSFRYTIKDNGGFVSNEATVTVTVNAVPDYQNPVLNADVNRSGQVSPIDALIVINYINANGSSLPADPIPPAQPVYYLDVNGDNSATPVDVLIVLNYLNARGIAGEGESSAVQPEQSTAADPASVRAAESSLLAVADYTLLRLDAPGQPANASPLAAELPTVARTVLREDAVAAAATDDAEGDAAFAAIGADTGQLLDLQWGDVLSEIADDVGGSQADQLAADWVLSGLRPGTV
jgi:hypothetical protein